MCPELKYFIEQMVVPLLSAVIGGLFVLYTTKRTLQHSSAQLHDEFEMERNAMKQNKTAALKTELNENLKAINEVIEGSVHSPISSLCYISISAWEGSREITGFYGEDIIQSLTIAYIKLGSIKNAVEWKISKEDPVSSNRYSMQVKSLCNMAKPLIEEAIKKLADAGNHQMK